jgi:hypothetical protein
VSFQLNIKTPLLPMILALLNLMVTFLPSNFAITSETLLLDFSSYSLAFVPHFLMFSVQSAVRSSHPVLFDMGFMSTAAALLSQPTCPDIIIVNLAGAVMNM